MVTVKDLKASRCLYSCGVCHGPIEHQWGDDELEVLAEGFNNGEIQYDLDEFQLICDDCGQSIDQMAAPN